MAETFDAEQWANVFLEKTVRLSGEEQWKMKRWVLTYGEMSEKPKLCFRAQPELWFVCGVIVIDLVKLKTELNHGDHLHAQPGASKCKRYDV